MPSSRQIAVIGLSCRFPDAQTPEDYWQGLLAGTEAIGPLSAKELAARGSDPALAEAEGFVNMGTTAPRAEWFDADFFRMTPREALLTDPQHRVFLQECRQLLDRANLTRSGQNRTGVFAACRMSSYQDFLGRIAPEDITRPETFQQFLGNDKDYLATRVAYKLNLTGPAMTVQTACSSSLVAVHQACASLANGECDAALAGGVGISFPQGLGYFAQPGMIFSEDGHCRPFGAAGRGIVAGNGLGVIALKRLEDARDAGDVIHAVICGSAVSNDGAGKTGFTAPGAAGQAAAIEAAFKTAGLSPRDVSMVEAHATGTPLGDPIEVGVLARLWSAAGVAPQSCALGSVKGNLGHMDTAAGIASLIKAIWAVKTGRIPASLHASPGNPNIDFDNLPFFVPETACDWPEGYERRVAAVSSFGIGGTNCHMIVAEPGQSQVDAESPPATEVLTLSAHTPGALTQTIEAAATYAETTSAPVTAWCRTNALRRQHHAHRAAVVLRRDAEVPVAEQIRSAATLHCDPDARLAFMFSGQGSQIANMGADFRRRSPIFAAAFEACRDGFSRAGIEDLEAAIATAPEAPDLNRTLYTQPALFAWQYALCRMLEDQGIQPDIVFGHSIGEYAAAVVAGALDLDAAISLVAARARAMENLCSEGAMLAVHLPEAEVDALRARFPDIHLAAVNAPCRLSLAGPVAQIEQLAQHLDTTGVTAQRLQVRRAFHSDAMDPAMPLVRGAAESCHTATLHCVMLSTLTGTSLGPGELTPDYWTRQMRQPVRFADCCAWLARDAEEHGPIQVLEIGPDGSFSRLVAHQSATTTLQVCDPVGTTPEELCAALFRAGHSAAVEAHYLARPGAFADCPPMVFDEQYYFPDVGDTVRPDEVSASDVIIDRLPVLLHCAAAALDEVCFTLDHPMPVASPVALAGHRPGFMGAGSIALRAKDGARELRYRPLGAPRDLPDGVIEELATASGLAVRSGWLAPGWTQASALVRCDEQIRLMHDGRCLGVLDCEPVVPAGQPQPVLWRWSWDSLPTPRTTSRPNCVQVLGDNSYASAVAETLRATDAKVLHSAEPEGVPVADLVLDCRFAPHAGPEQVLSQLSAAQAACTELVQTPQIPRWLVLSDSAAPAPGTMVPQGWALMTLIRSLRNEAPDLPVGLLALPETDLPQLPDLLTRVMDRPEVVLLQEAAGLRTPILTEAPGAGVPPALPWHQGATLLAGFGAVGRVLALWLAEQGCRELVLVMHRALDPEQQSVVKQLVRAGCRVSVLQDDLRNPASLAGALAELGTSIRFAFHTAHAGDSRLLRDEDPAHFSATLATKITGSMTLTEALHDHPLEMLCLFSSAASALAMPGAAYNVANAWQDEYAAQLRAQGIPALSIAWGQWDMMRDANRRDQTDSTFFVPIPADAGFADMAGLMARGDSAVIPIAYRPDTLAASIAGLPATVQVLSAVTGDLSAGTSQQAAPPVTLSPDLPRDPAARRSHIMDWLTQQIATRLKFAPEQLSAERELTTQGVDSLIFLEIVQVINRSFDLSLPPTAGYDHKTIAALSRVIADQTAAATPGAGDIAFASAGLASDRRVQADPDSRHAPFPLTDLQQAFWLGRDAEANMGGVSCHEYVELELTELDCAALEHAWNQLIERHEMMRCVITPDGQQRILPEVPDYEIAHLDLRDVSPEQRQDQLSQIRNRMTYQVFDPHQWPLFELRVSHLPDGVTRVHLDMDLLVFDIQSFRVIYGELAQLLRDPDTVLPLLELSFRDYMLAEKATEADAVFARARDHWQARLDQIPPAPDLPLIQAPETLARPVFRTLDHTVPPQVWQRFQARAIALGLTPSGALLTAFTQALALYARSPKFTLNITYFNRKAMHPQVMDICGDFTSLMLLPVHADREEAFDTAARRTQADLWQALEHRDYNGIRVMRDLGRHAGDGAGSVQMPVVFTSMIGMDFDDPDQPDHDLMKSQIFEVNQTPQVWLDYQATEFGGALLNRWFIADDLFDSALIEGLFDSYTRFLDHLARSPEAWTGLIPDLRSPAQQAATEALMSTDTRDLPETMADLYQDGAEVGGAAPAILTLDDMQRHDDLRLQVNRLAHALQRQGLPPGAPVAVVMDKSPKAVLAALAIQAAGGCYVPVNADVASDRLARILTDLSPFCILSEMPLAAQVTSAPVLSPGALLSEADVPDVTPGQGPNPGDPAYVIYTSGTTGDPKGVILDHIAPVNTLCHLARRLDLSAGDRALSMCAFHHDMSVFDVFGMLGHGGAVILPDPAHGFDAGHWLDLMERHAPSILNAVPAFVQMLLDAAEARGVRPPAPRHVMMGGDWIAPDLVHRLHRMWPETVIHSIGGPTETAIVSAHYRLPDRTVPGDAVPYGRPLENQTCYLLNEIGQEVPPGITGEICTGGLALSQGYLNDPMRTAERYRRHALRGEILFHTGDLGRINAEGQLEILGRADNQIKINGQRVEPGEIETALKELTEVQDAAVVFGGTPKAQLQAFLTARPLSSAEDPAQAPQSHRWTAAQAAGAAAVNSLDPAFDPQAYAQTYADMEQLSTWVMLDCIRDAGFLQTPGATVRHTALLIGLKVAEGSQKLFESWLRILCEDGYLTVTGNGEASLYTATEQLSCLRERSALQSRIAARASHGAPYEQRIWSLLERAISHLPDLLAGRFNPLELMFEGGETDFVESWYRENPVSQHFNRTAGTIAAALARAHDRSRPFRVLEFGAGIGSVTHDVLAALSGVDYSYDFTDLSRYFLDLAQAQFGTGPQMRYDFFDINRDPGLQGFALGQYDLILGANVLHDAHDVHAASRRLRALLAPDGVMMLVEGTTNPRFQLISLGFVEGLTQYADERLETCLPMLSAPSWEQVMQRAGFAHTDAFPRAGDLAEVMNYHVILGHAPVATPRLDGADLRRALARKLPAHMIPSRWHQLVSFPLTRNGKTDRPALADACTAETADVALATDATTPLASDTEHQLAALWATVLDRAPEGAEANFFALGGDSLLMTRLNAKLHAQMGVETGLATLLRHPVLQEQAAMIDILRQAQSAPEVEDESWESGVL